MSYQSRYPYAHESMEDYRYRIKQSEDAKKRSPVAQQAATQGNPVPKPPKKPPQKATTPPTQEPQAPNPYLPSGQQKGDPAKERAARKALDNQNARSSGSKRNPVVNRAPR